MTALGRGRPSFLRSDGYVDFLTETHPELEMSRVRLPVPSYRTQIILKDAMRPGSWLRQIVSALAPVLPSRPRALCIGVPFEPYDQTHLLGRLKDPASFVRACREQTLRCGSGLCFFPNVDPSHPGVDALEREGFRIVPSFPDMRIDLDVDSFEGHLAKIHRDDRSGIRRNIRKFERAGHRLERLRSGEEHAELFKAYRTFQERALVPWVPHTVEYFRRLPEMHPDVRVHVARSSAGRLLGFVVNFWESGHVQSGRIGVVPEYDRRDSVYFRLLYRAVEDALVAPSARFLSLEPTGYRTKRHLGARRVPLVNLLLGASRFWRAALTSAPLARRFLRHLEEPKMLERFY